MGVPTSEIWTLTKTMKIEILEKGDKLHFLLDTHSCHTLTSKADCTILMQKSHFCQSTRCGQDKTKFKYPATFPLRFPHRKLIKIGNPAPARHQNSRFPLLFWAHIPRITTKNSQIPHPTKPIVDPLVPVHGPWSHISKTSHQKLKREVSRMEKRFKIAIMFSGRRRRSREERNGFVKADVVK